MTYVVLPFISDALLLAVVALTKERRSRRGRKTVTIHADLADSVVSLSCVPCFFVGVFLALAVR